MSSSFRQATLRFKNIAKFTVVTHKTEDVVIAEVSRMIKVIFKSLDNFEDDAKKLAADLWVFKTILNSTLVPFNDPMLRLKEMSSEILTLLEKRNTDFQLIDGFKNATRQLWSKHTNKKFEQLLSFTDGVIGRNDSIGIVGKILYGDDPACINLTISSLSNYGMNFTNIVRKHQLNSSSLQKIIIVSSPIKPTMELMKAIFYTGVIPELHLILYDHENFYAPSRIELPLSPLFQNNIQKFKISSVIAPELVADMDEFSSNTWAEESFWSDIHGGSRTKTVLSVDAHYILFDGGEGAFMPAGGKILHIDKNDSEQGSFSYELSYVEILDLVEGDYVLLRKNSSGFLLNEETYGVSNEEEDDIVLDQITDWKNALSALSITKDYSEISQLMRDKGLIISPGKIKQWEGIDVIAPNSEIEFSCLISVLADEGKLNSSIKDVEKYSADKWASIHEYRISRQKAGNRARQTILETLLAKIDGLDIDSPDGAKSLDLQLGQNLLIRRVASIDHSISYVQLSSLYRIDDLRGNKWLR
jgi:hypothetical protein